MKFPSRRGQLAGLLLLATSLASCAAIFGFDDLRESAGDGGTDTPADGPAQGADSSADDAGADAEPARVCPPPVGIPPRPSGAAATGPAYRFALDSLRLAPDPGETLGFNLDCVDTRTLDASSCAVSPKAEDSTLQSLVIDHADGVDNAIAPVLFGALDLYSERLRLDRLSNRVRQGVLGATLTVLDVGSFAEDNNVLVKVFPARNGVVADAGNCLPVDSGSTYHQNNAAPLPPDDAAARELDASDEWCIDSRFSNGALSSDQAWIADHTLVAHFPKLVVPYLDENEPFYSLDMELDDVWVRARIDDASGAPRLADGMIGGRWRISTLLREINLNASLNATCDLNPTVVGPAKALLCTAGDLGAGSDPSEACSQLSVGLGFSAYSVKSEGVPAFVPTYDFRCYPQPPAPDPDAGDAAAPVDAGDAGDPYAVTCDPD